MLARRPVDRTGARFNRRNKTQTASIPAPVGGLNARDAIANMPETDAVVLENWFPTPSSVDLRNGSTKFSTGYPAWVETVMKYTSPTANSLWGVSDGKIYDGTVAGAIVAAAVSGLTNSRFQHVNFTNSANSWLYAVNGADGPQLYNGTAWQTVTQVSAPIAITGVAPSTFISVNAFKSRLFFIPVSSTTFWYLAVNAVGGAASQFDLGPLMTLGGYLMAMVTWSIDNASGLQEYAAFVSSEGEVFVYQGNDPSFAATWGLVSKFRIGKPIGRRCYEKVGSDVILITADGFFPLSQALLTDRSQVNLAISNKISDLVNIDVASYKGNFGWQALLHPIGQKIIVNVPQIENNTQYQYVMNTTTGAWTKFTGWNAACWELFQDNVYFGGNTYISLADDGQDDDGVAIQATAIPAFSYFGSHAQKMFSLIRPIFYSDGIVNAGIALCLNFSTMAVATSPAFTGNSGSLWNVNLWNVTMWGGASNTIAFWQTAGGVGFSASIKMVVLAKDMGVQWQSTDYVFTEGGVL